MKNKKEISIKIIAIFCIIMLSILNLNIFASSTQVKPANITLESNKTNVSPGDSIVLDVKMSNITLSSGISTINFVLDLDENVFETVKVQDIDADRMWTKTYNSTTKLLKLTTTQKVKEDKSLVKISLKAKSTFGSSDITSSQNSSNVTTLSLKNIKLNVSRNVDDVSIKLSLGSTNLPQLPQLNNNNNQTVLQNENKQPTKNPDAGLDNPYIIGIVTLAIIATLSILGHKKASGKIG